VRFYIFELTAWGKFMYLDELKTVIFIGIVVLFAGGVLVTGASLIWNYLFNGLRSGRASTGRYEEGEPKTRAEGRQHIAIIREEVGKAKRAIEEGVTKRMIITKAEMERLHARDADRDEAWATAVLWWSRALKDYADLDEQTRLWAAVQMLRGSLDKCQMIDDTVREEVESCLPLIPDAHKSERDAIGKKLKELAKPAQREAA
jgi:hypothetical protein